MPDERVEAAIKNWAPRFTSQGVDYNDFFRTTSRVEKWEAVSAMRRAVVWGPLAIRRLYRVSAA